jgi:hypothetical protein
MTRGLLRALMMSAGAAMAIMPAHAQPLPSGSYQQTCDSISVNNTTLRARCQASDGDWSFSQLSDADECDGDISNDDGNLSCVRERDRDGRGSDRIPAGSYQDSCQQERAMNGDLAAVCADRNGRMQQARLQDYADCRGDIGNDNGALRCERADRSDDNNDGNFGVPVGSWRETCRDQRVSRNVLIAECRNRQGRWVVTSVDLRSCDLGVSNNNGQLACVRKPAAAARISLYLNTSYRGLGRTFTGDIPNLARYGFANNVSSVYLRTGAWQLCTRVNYSGRCIILRAAATPNLGRFGFNDKVRSIRRVR